MLQGLGYRLKLHLLLLHSMLGLVAKSQCLLWSAWLTLQFSNNEFADSFYMVTLQFSNNGFVDSVNLYQSVVPVSEVVALLVLVLPLCGVL